MNDMDKDELERAYIAGYIKRAKMSGLIADEVSEFYAENCFKHWWNKQKLGIPAIVSKRPTIDEVRDAANDYAEMTSSIIADNILKQKTADFEAGAYYILGLAACDSEKGGEKSGCGWVCYDSMECAQFGCQKPED